jgi:hypothetical protein
LYSRKYIESILKKSLIKENMLLITNISKPDDVKKYLNQFENYFEEDAIDSLMKLLLID